MKAVGVLAAGCDAGVLAEDEGFNVGVLAALSWGSWEKADVLKAGLQGQSVLQVPS